MAFILKGKAARVDVNQIYFNSPDWIKAILVIAPFITAYAIARLALLRRPPEGRGAGPEPHDPPRQPPLQIEAVPRRLDDAYIRFLEERLEALTAPEHRLSALPAEAREPEAGTEEASAGRS